MALTRRDELEIGLRYIRRVKSMQPSQRAMRDLDRQEEALRAELDQLPAEP